MIRSPRTAAAVALLWIAVATHPLRAQAPLAPPPQLAYGLPISTTDAKAVATAAIAEAQRHGWTMAVAIVDPGGHLVYFERMQDTQTGSVDVAIDKARTAALFRRPTKLFQDAVAGGGEGLRVLRLTGVIPIEGGVPVIISGKVIGAIGVSGGTSEQDGQAARSGVTALK